MKTTHLEMRPAFPSHDRLLSVLLLLLLLLLLAALGSGSQDARATCGATFCMVNTSWSVQGAWTEPGLRLDLRYEFIDQEQPRHGSNKVGVGQISRHHDEVRTINRNLLATLDYAFDGPWGVSATLPVTDRDHAHIHNQAARVFGRRGTSPAWATCACSAGDNG